MHSSTLLIASLYNLWKNWDQIFHLHMTNTSIILTEIFDEGFNNWHIEEVAKYLYTTLFISLHQSTKTEEIKIIFWLTSLKQR